MLCVSHTSPKVADILSDGDAASMFHQDIFKLLADRWSGSSSLFKAFKKTTIDSIERGKALSNEACLVMGDRGSTSSDGSSRSKAETRYASHWTPCKDVDGTGKYVILVFAEK